MDSQQHEQALHKLGLRNADELADCWASYGIRPHEMVVWITVGVPVDEPHIAAALAAAEWTPLQAARSLSSTNSITLIQAVRQHPNAVTYAREMRSASA